MNRPKVQFKKAQRSELARTWNKDSWFYSTLGEPARLIVEQAYGLRAAEPKLRTSCQEDVTLALSIFASTIGCEKSQAAHALLSGSLNHLVKALHKVLLETPTNEELEEAWQGAFRQVAIGNYGHAEDV